MSIKIKDPVSSITHLIGLIISIPVIAILIYYAYIKATFTHVISFIIFGVAIILLYGASCFYHIFKTEALHRLDHMMIFVMIAGTYTPICLIILNGIWGGILLFTIWSMACCGILLKVFWMNGKRWISTAIYVIMGWTIILAFYPLINAIPLKGVMLLIAGGLFYTIGAVIYAAKWPNFNLKLFGFHEIFHLFVLGGSCLHIIFMFIFVLKF